MYVLSLQPLVGNVNIHLKKIIILLWPVPLIVYVSSSKVKQVQTSTSKNYLYLTTGVNQKVLPVLSTETLLHIWLSTEYYGFRPSSTAVDTGDTRGLMMSE